MSASHGFWCVKRPSESSFPFSQESWGLSLLDTGPLLPHTRVCKAGWGKGAAGQPRRRRAVSGPKDTRAAAAQQFSAGLSLPEGS